ncbi:MULTISPECIES: LysR family transcriptional regulator [Pseudomonas]|uniref:HTH-type transcriptional regulator PgrR n=1 Tax=Pseudomonas frederiksbergensis TaxID=104087 RepID=A0A6L5BZE5_9PSED|nr:MULTISPECIES: LysR family transcriptional regulator [Pseudomonas]KAF2393680.1 HTH-type transcriptional regulator PgrR [Pseudomonas frederiksbergensis]UZE13733.1 LysR family transcriptional regulator [Pseudomonas sp. B21-053]
MNQLLAMRVFARVVQAGSFTKAADSLSLPKTSVSKLVAELEEHLGVRLLQRTTRRLTVTADGMAYYERAMQLMVELDDLDNSFACAQGQSRGKVRVDVGGSVATLLIIPALPDFYARYPNIQIEMGVSDRQVDLISENVDCVIRGGPLDELSMAARPLGTSSWVTCATPGYLERFGTPSDPRDLEKNHHIITYHSARTGRVMPARFERHGEKLEIRGQRRFSVNESNAHLAAGLAGLGVIHTFTYSVQAHIERGELVPILEDWRPPRYPFHVLYPPNRHLSNRVRVFIDWLAQLFAGLS